MEGAPAEPVSAVQLIQEQQAILLCNAENKRKRERLAQLLQEQTSLRDQIDMLKEQLEQVSRDVVTAQTDAADLVDQSTAELETSIANVEQINQSVRINQAKTEAQQRADELSGQYKQLTTQIEDVRRKRRELLEKADLPLPGLSVENGTLLYNGKAWDCMSGSDQLKVAVAIVRRLNPKCGFVLMDKLEQMDTDTLTAFGQWLEQEGLQVIATRVSSGDECSIIIEDGFSKESAATAAPATPKVTWTPGKF